MPSRPPEGREGRLATSSHAARRRAQPAGSWRNGVPVSTQSTVGGCQGAPGRNLCTSVARNIITGITFGLLSFRLPFACFPDFSFLRTEKGFLWGDKANLTKVLEKSETNK